MVRRETVKSKSPVDDLKNPKALMLNEAVSKALEELSQIRAEQKDESKSADEDLLRAGEKVAVDKLITALTAKKEFLFEVQQQINEYYKEAAEADKIDSNEQSAQELKKRKTDLELINAAVNDIKSQLNELTRHINKTGTAAKKKATIPKSRLEEGIAAVLIEATKTKSERKAKQYIEQEADKVEDKKITTSKKIVETEKTEKETPKATPKAAKAAKPETVSAEATDNIGKKTAVKKAATVDAPAVSAEKKAVKKTEDVAPKTTKVETKTESAAPKAAKAEAKTESAAPKAAKAEAKKPAKKPVVKEDETGRYRIKANYKNSIVAAMVKRFNYKNINQVPKIEKIVVSRGLGDAKDDSKKFNAAVDELALICGQKPIVTKAKKSIANFKVREGMNIGAKVTLRGNRMFEFLDKLISMALPRVRDFRGLSTKSFDGRGNYTFGIKEQLIFPEIKYDSVEKVRGFDVIIVTTAKTDEEAKALLENVGMPFGN